MSPLVIRPADTADVEALSDLAQRTFPLACPPELPAAAIREYCARHLTADRFRAYLDDPAATVLYALQDERPIGYSLSIAGTAMDPSCAALPTVLPTTGISKLYVDPLAHGGGVAGELLGETFSAIAARGSRGVWLATNVHNARARRFYVKNGFRECGRRDFDVGGVRNEDVVYERAV